MNATNPPNRGHILHKTDPALHGYTHTVQLFNEHGQTVMVKTFKSEFEAEKAARRLVRMTGLPTIRAYPIQ